MNCALDPFRERILALERNYVKNKYSPINIFLTELKQFQAFFNFLKQFIDEVETQQIHGCAILSALNKFNYFADAHGKKAYETIRSGVYAVFLRQFSQWLIYGQLVDIFNEFFIVRCRNLSTTTVMTPTTSIGELMCNDNELWDINYNMIPSNFSTSWAEKVLFIGQIVYSTVLALSGNSGPASKRVAFIWKDDEERIQIGSLWNAQEHIFFAKIQTLSTSHDIGEYDQVVNEIKRFVSDRLSEIAFNQADLIKHLKLFREYFLLGRGGLFSEFITQLQNIKKFGYDENQAILDREIIQAFQRALNRTSTETDMVSVCLQNQRNGASTTDFTQSFAQQDDSLGALLNLIRLKMTVKWPLHLFFSSKIFDQYNSIFSFLLYIRHIQNDLHGIWRLHRDRKIAGNSQSTQLRNKMLFLIDNLLYYLQVDVLEAHFSILMNTIQCSKDFDQIIRAHNIFLGNVLCLSFLLNAEQQESPVLVIFKKIFQVIRSFCLISATYNEDQSCHDFEEIDQK